ncbi:RES family NAD+ phosphorylase [Cereibacter sphaeroides]|uniref:RES family NAD+ phosphorylase n=1 Tax=Cereibacter sphaeroides TaxID=1063 RepID=UPI001F394715|nr:RES family NAD+ phosphorylase [Cereibacter sphaeroides]MCE6958964.1 RES family NAD+ phosphorylase [Cereibacter sphaeroides]MCE6969028.1 RES family NAD+ phosphorylase [Cereibacter sphaeroides]MCE6973694.1 RES family NAD+ phosphorylase [Cereibacter sphaeroides]
MVRRRVVWDRTHRIIRSRFPPIDLFEDIADPADWEAIASAEAKTNPRLRDSLGRLDLVPPERRVSGPGASFAMACFTHVSPDRPSRFSDGSFGVYYAAESLDVALVEVAHHHGRFMAATAETTGWTSEFRQLVGRLDAELEVVGPDRADLLDPHDYRAAQDFGARLREGGADGILYPSARAVSGFCVALFWPDVAGPPAQGDHFAFEWDGSRVSRIRNLVTGELLAL